MSGRRFDIAAIKSRVVMSTVAAKAGVKLDRAGAGKFMGCCPFHDDRTPSLAIDDGKGLWRCHGCGAGGDCFAFVQRIEGLPFMKAVRLLAEDGDVQVAAQPRNARPIGNDDSRLVEIARRIWEETGPHGMVTAYLRGRGIAISPPATLRFHPALFHRATGLKLPAMVGAVNIWPSREITGIHRTWLTEDGRKAPVSSNKMTLGNCKGGAVRLAPPGPVLVIGEGVETVLSVMQATGLPGWSAMNASNLSAIVLPDEAREIIIAADNDASGTGEREARKAADRFTAEGRIARIAMPDHPGIDFNDIVQEAVEHA
ncbi:DUF7146 domain-containing protein [Zavarzinia aquatilis]|uniref:Virulence-associated protein E n=1 Tax=Zavarzinia aquatilis TaxID=2211142 RepID=A0A317EG84_9PROT|nr:toprim domain-containing protein [Zavarzinia aquatilis]PWR24215.1 virulence-associated protein E [Zavarzinia aquatilis]